MKQALRLVPVAIAWLAVGLGALVLSVSYHLQLSETREALRTLVEQLASDGLQGDLQVGSIDEIAIMHGRVRFSNVRMLDDRRRVVIDAPRVTAWADLPHILRTREIRIAGGRVEQPDITLYVVDDYGDLDPQGLQVSFARTFTPTNQGPGDGSRGPRVIIDGLDVVSAHVHGDVPRYPGLVIEDLSVRGRIDINDPDSSAPVLIEAFDGHGRMTSPYSGETAIDDVDVRFSTDWSDGVTAYLALSRDADRATADVRVDRPEHWPEQGPPRLSIWIHTDPICARTLERMGFPGLDRIDGCARGWAQLFTRPEGPYEDILIAGTLDTDAGLALVRGELPGEGRFAFELETPGLELATLVPTAPAARLAGRARLELIDEPDDPTVGIVTVDLHGFEIGGYVIPGFEGTAALTRDAVLIERVAAPHLDGEVSLTGRVGFDGAIDVEGHVDVSDIGADPNVALRVPGAHGAVRGDLTIHSEAGGERLEVDSTFDAGGVRYGPLRASSLHGRAWVRGDAPTPDLAIHLTGEHVSVSDVDLAHVQLDADGGGARPYRIQLDSHGGRGIQSASVRGHAVRRGDAIEITLDQYALDVGLGSYVGPADGTPTRVIVRGSEIELDSLDLRTPDDAAMVLSGALRPSGHSDLHFILRDFPLATLQPRLPEGLSHLTGSLDLEATLRGPLSEPDMTVAGRIDDASLDGTRGFAVTYSFQYADGTLQTLVDGDLGTRGGLHVSGPIHVPFAVLTSPARFPREARFDDLEFDLDQANLAFVLPFFGENVRALEIAGRATVALVLRGTLEDPELPRAIVILDRFGLPGWTPVRMKAELSFLDDELRATRVWLADTTGEIALMEAGIHVSLADPPSDLAGWLARIAASPFHLAARIEPRRLDGLPRPLSKHLPRGITVGGSVTLYNGPEGAMGNLEALVRWDEAASDAPCAHDLRPVVQIHASSEGDSTVARLDGFVSDRPVLHGTARAPTPFATWLASAEVPIPLADVAVAVEHLPLEALPWTCPYANGTVDGEVAFQFGDTSPDLDARLEVTGLRVHSPTFAGATSRPFHAGLAATIGGDGDATLSTCLIVSEEDGAHTGLGSCPSSSSLQSGARTTVADEGEVVAVADVPLTIEPGGLGVPTVDWSDDFFVWAELSNAHLEPALAFVSVIAEADVVANGTVSARGGWESLTLDGGLDLRDGRTRIAAIGQHLHSIEGVVRLEGNRLLFPEDRPLTAMDGDARVDVSGEVGFHGLVPAWAYLTLRPDRFPIRREGAVLAMLTGEADLRATIGTDGVEGTIVANTLEVGLPPTIAGGVQALELRRDVLVIGDEAPELAMPSGARFPFHIRVSAPSFTVVRNDFSADVRADLDVTWDAPDLYVGGTAEIERGTFEVLGKRFEVQRGALVFVGDAEMDPDVLLVASYALPGRSGASVTITVVGRLSNLSVDFSSTESTDTGEIVALLVSGRSTQRQSGGASAQQAGDQAANFLAGITAGILTLGLRQQFGGQFVPNVAVETGDRLGSVGLRVGFNADWLIPDFAREVVLAAYVEGFVGSTGTTGGATQGSGGVGGGVSLEFQLPLNGVISGTYVPVSSGGLDLLWEP